ncbi:MAG: aminopeptidase P family protein [Acidobacteria bacterium]|nr:aminopeptidase P family protein [Acidobacteriota bacterium]
MININLVQQALRDSQVDGWLFYYFHDNDPIAQNLLGLTCGHLVSRRWFYLIPSQGDPIKIVHRIEMEALDSLPGRKLAYVGWRELEQKLREALSGMRQVAMQYSPKNAIPYISRVDAGTVELISALGVKVVSSADMVSQFESTWTDAQLAGHVEAAEALHRIVFLAFDEIKRRLRAQQPTTEYDVQQFIMRCYQDHGMMTSSPPIVAVNEHSGNPHYQPTSERHSEIRAGDLVLLDIWAKPTREAAVYADITWTGFLGETIPAEPQKIFDIVRGGRDAALAFVEQSVAAGREIYGWQVDDVARRYISARGYGEYFIHRTGHSIGLEVHGNGANIDNLETRDERRLLPRTAFSIEPGVYLPEFGIRSEIDVYMGEREVLVAGRPIQTEIVAVPI